MEVYALTWNQRIPDWLPAASLGRRSRKALIIPECHFGKAGNDWKTAVSEGTSRYTGEEKVDLEAQYHDLRRTPADFDEVKARRKNRQCPRAREERQWQQAGTNGDIDGDFPRLEETETSLSQYRRRRNER